MLQSFLLTNVLFELIVSRSLKVSCSENEFLVTQSVFFVRKPAPDTMCKVLQKNGEEATLIGKR